MNSATVISLARARDRGRRVARAVDARRRIRDSATERRQRRRPNGRAWVNGSELGGARAALSHLGESYD